MLRAPPVGRALPRRGAGQLDVLGGEATDLAAMTDRGLAVPPGFATTTGSCRTYLAGDG